MKEVRVQLRIPPEVHRVLTAFAKQNDRSMNGQIVAILRERLPQPTQKASAK